MTKYKLEDLKAGAVFKDGGTTITIIAVGRADVFYTFPATLVCDYVEDTCPIGEFLSGKKGDLVVPTTEIAYSDLKVDREIMSKYTLEDLKVGAVFKNSISKRLTIIAVGKSKVFYTFPTTFSYVEHTCSVNEFLSGEKGELVRPTTKIAYVEYWSCHDLSVKRYCSKELWDSRTSTKFNKLIREFEIEVDEDGFPVDGAL